MSGVPQLDRSKLIDPDTLEKSIRSIQAVLATEKMVHLKEIIDRTHAKIKEHVKEHTQEELGDMSTGLGQRFNMLKMAKDDAVRKRREIMENKFPRFCKQFPGIWGIFMEGRDESDTFDSFLASYKKMYNGQTSTQEMLDEGTRFMESRRKVPAGFFQKFDGGDPKKDDGK